VSVLTTATRAVTTITRATGQATWTAAATPAALVWTQAARAVTTVKAKALV